MFDVVTAAIEWTPVDRLQKCRTQQFVECRVKVFNRVQAGMKSRVQNMCDPPTTRPGGGQPTCTRPRLSDTTLSVLIFCLIRGSIAGSIVLRRSLVAVARRSELCRECYKTQRSSIVTLPTDQPQTCPTRAPLSRRPCIALP